MRRALALGGEVYISDWTENLCCTSFAAHSDELTSAYVPFALRGSLHPECPQVAAVAPMSMPPLPQPAAFMRSDPVCNARVK